MDNTNKTFIIAEIAQAHEGSFNQCFAFIDAAKECGVDAVKFQTHIAQAESTSKEEWRKKFSFKNETRFEYWQRMGFSGSEWKQLKEYTHKKGLYFISSPFSEEAVDLLLDLDLDFWKVASGEVLSYSMLDKMIKSKKHIFVSTGMSSWDEIDEFVGYLKYYKASFTLLQCSTAYPTTPKVLGLNIVTEMQNRYHCQVGLSDHYHYVFKELQVRDLWGCFFISQQPYLTKHLLNVHRVHLLLGLYGGADVHKKMEEFFDLNSIDYKENEIFKKSVYLRQTNDEATTQVKKIINYYLSASEQNELLDKMAQKYLKESIEQYYLLPSQIQQMYDAGMLIGSHGVNHSLMSKLSKEEQTFELCESFSFIKQLLGPEWLAAYCHPYGGKLSYNTETLEILKNLNCIFGFAVDPRDIVNTDFDDNNIYTLPRFDCNQFPFGKAISIL